MRRRMTHVAGPPCRHNFLRARQHYYFCARCGLRRYRTLPVGEEAPPAAARPGRLRGFLAGAAAGFAAASCAMAALLVLLRGW